MKITNEKQLRNLTDQLLGCPKGAFLKQMMFSPSFDYIGNREKIKSLREQIDVLKQAGVILRPYKKAKCKLCHDKSRQEDLYHVCVPRDNRYVWLCESCLRAMLNEGDE